MQAYSREISATMPQPYQGGLGSTGMGFSSHPGPFNYGMASSMNSYAPGNTVANSGLSMIGGGMQAGMAGLGVLGGMGMLGSAGKMFDPFSMAMGGFGMGGRMGVGIGGRIAMGAAGAAIPLAIGAGVSHIAGSMVAGGQEQAGIEQVLSKFQFQNAGSRTGRGFNRQDSMQIGNMVRELAHIPDMLTSVGELTKVMEKIGNMGLMNGVRDANQFQQKFKQTLGTIKDVARIMGTTLDDAASAFGEARRSGFYSQGEVVKNAINRQVTSGLTGMNQQQVGQMQQYGAQMGFATGGSRASGAKLITRTAQQLGMMNQAGMLTNDQIMELTGEEGGAGIQSMAASLTEAGYKMSKSSLGTAMTLALGETKDGRYTGKMDQTLTERMRRGEIGKTELMALAHKKAASRSAKLSFAAHRQKLTSEMVGAVGAEGIAMELAGILGERGFDNPDAHSLVMQRYGVDERQADQIMAMGKLSNTGELQNRQKSEAKRAARSAYMAENFSWDAIKKKISTKIESVVTEPFKQMGVGIRDAIANKWDEFIDDVTGHYSAQMSSGVSSLIRDVASGKSGASKNLSALLSGPGATGSFLGGTQKGGIAGALRSFSGSGADKAAGLAKQLGFGELVGNVSAGSGQAAMAGFAKRIASQGTGAIRAGSEDDYDDAKRQIQEMMTSEGMEGKSDIDRFQAIVAAASSAGDDANMVDPLSGATMGMPSQGSAFERLAKKKGMTVERLVASMVSGDADIKRMKNRPDLGKIFSGEGDLASNTEALSKERKDLERQMSGSKGLSAVQGALNNGSLVSGGALMKALTAGDTEQQDILTELGSENPNWDKLRAHGITKDNAQDAYRLFQATKGAGKDGREKLLRYAKVAAKETDSLMKEHLQERAMALSSLTSTKLSGLGKSLAAKLKGGDYEHLDSDISGMIQSLAGMSKKERDAAFEDMQKSGNVELRTAFEEYRKETKGGKKQGEALAAAVGKAKDQLFSSASGREGSTFASDEAVKSYFDKLNDNQSQIAQILGNIAAGKNPGEGMSAGKT